MDVLLLAIGLVIGVLAGWLAAVLTRGGPGTAAPVHDDPALVAARHDADVLRMRAEEAAERTRLQAAAAADHAEAAASLAAADATIDGLRGQLADRTAQSRTLEQRHGELTAAERRRLSDEAAERERLATAEGAVMTALAPIRETLQTMAGKVTELETQRAEQYGAIEQQLAQTREANEQVRATAEGLASSLRNNSVRGAWGEAQLRRIVEAAGLTQRVDFDLQTSTTGEDGTRRPDMVVRLPEGRCIAVDAKVPLAKFLEANEIPATATGVEGARREALLKEHVKAVRAHIDALSAKGYWAEFDSPEFVVAFLPSESLLSAALGADPSLLDHSFGKRVALASPVNLWAVLKTVAHTWNQQRLTDEAQTLFTLSNTLYERLGLLAARAEKLRGSIEGTVRSYNAFVGTLESRVLVTARQINRMDESKIIGEVRPIDATARPLTQAELLADEPSLEIALDAAPPRPVLEAAGTR